jgi:hypothetical protein
MYGVIVSESSMNKYNIFADLYALKLKIAGKVLKLPAIAGSRCPRKFGPPKIWPPRAKFPRKFGPPGGHIS